MARAAALGFLIATAIVPLWPAEAATIEVTIANMAFSPASITAQPGDIVVWTNKDFVAHTATARDKSFDVMVPPGKSASLTLGPAAKLDYFCKFHPMMKGSISIGP